MVIHIERNLFDSGADIILHQVNCQGVMGSGVAKQVRERYPWVYATYRDLCNKELQRDSSVLLGVCQMVYIDEFRYVCNMFGQDEYGSDGRQYTNYQALRKAFVYLKEYCAGKTIALPYLMGCHRGGGDWSVVEKMIHEIFDSSSNTLMICKYNGG